MKSPVSYLTRTGAALSLAVAAHLLHAEDLISDNASRTGGIANSCANSSQLLQVQKLSKSTEIVGIGPTGERWRRTLPASSEKSLPFHASSKGNAVVLATNLAGGEAFLVTDERTISIDNGYIQSADFANGHTIVVTTVVEENKPRSDTRVRVFRNKTGAIVGDYVITDAERISEKPLEREWSFRLSSDAKYIYYFKSAYDAAFKELAIVDVNSGRTKGLALRLTDNSAWTHQVYDAVLLSGDSAIITSGLGGGLYYLNSEGAREIETPSSIGTIERLQYVPERQEVATIGQSGWAIRSLRDSSWKLGESGTGLVRLQPDSSGWTASDRKSSSPVRFYTLQGGQYTLTRSLKNIPRSAKISCVNSFGAMVLDGGEFVWRRAD